METIEIRQNKKTLIPMICGLGIALVAMTYYIYFSGKFDNNNTMKLLYVFLTASLLYAIYIPTRKFIKNEPILILAKDSIEIIDKKKTTSIHWLQIRDWKIENDEGTRYLIIDTAEIKKKINISWLDKTPEEIEILITKFKNPLS